MSVVLNYKLKISKHFSITLDGKRLGGSYNSLGNPYMLNNRIIFRAAEKSTLISDKVFVHISYDYMKDNSNKAATLTRENHSVSTSLALTVSQKLPSVTVGYRTFLGNTYGLGSVANSKVNSNSIFGSLNYSVKLNKFIPQISISRNDMNLISEFMTDTRQQINDVTLALTYKTNYGFDVQGIDIKQQIGDAEIPQQTLAARAWFKLSKPDLKFSIRVMKNSITYTGIGTETRNTIQAGIDYAPIKKLIISINGGTSPFTSYAPEKNYNEQFLQVRLNCFF